MLDPTTIASGAVGSVAGGKVAGHIEHALDPASGAKFQGEHPLWLMALDALQRLATLEHAANKWLDAQNTPQSTLMLPVVLSARQDFKLNRLGRDHAAIMVAVTTANVNVTIDGMGAMESITLTASQWNALDIPDGSILALASGVADVPALIWLGKDLPAGLG